MNSHLELHKGRSNRRNAALQDSSENNNQFPHRVLYSPIRSLHLQRRVQTQHSQDSCMYIEMMSTTLYLSSLQLLHHPSQLCHPRCNKPWNLHSSCHTNSTKHNDQMDRNYWQQFPQHCCGCNSQRLQKEYRPSLQRNSPGYCRDNSTFHRWDWVDSHSKCRPDMALLSNHPQA